MKEHSGHGDVLPRVLTIGFFTFAVPFSSRSKRTRTLFPIAQPSTYKLLQWVQCVGMELCKNKRFHELVPNLTKGFCLTSVTTIGGHLAD